MKTTYLSEYQKHKIAYLPVGTFEWHGNHLPLETDVIVAETFCVKLAERIPGYVLPGIYLGTDKAEDGRRGMERHVGKALLGELYYIEPSLLREMLTSLVKNLEKDGFEKIVIITGHGGSKQIETLESIDRDNELVIFESPYKALKEVKVTHADENETATLWYCRPEEEKKSRAKKIEVRDDYFNFLGYDPREKASVALGERLFSEMLDSLEQRIKGRL